MRRSRANGLLALAIAVGTVLPAAPLALAADQPSQVGKASTYFSVSPRRVLDTRVGNGFSGKVGPDGVVRINIAGSLGLTTGAVPTAAVLNITVVKPTGPTYVSAYPDGGQRPVVSNVNTPGGDTVTTNRAIVQVGADGYIDLYNHSGDVDLVADLEGFYTGVGENGSYAGSTYVPGAPARLLDTRTAIGDRRGPVGPDTKLVADVSKVTDPQAGDTDLVLQVTATDATQPSYVTAYAADLPASPGVPGTSDLNFAAGQSVTNLSFVDVGRNGLALYNHSGSVDLVLDYVGKFERQSQVTADSPGRFLPASPTRVLDTRAGLGAPTAKVGPDGVVKVKVDGLAGAPEHPAAVVVNLTAADADRGSYVTAYAADSAKPSTSNLNFGVGLNTAAMAIVPVSADGYINLYNHSGNVNLIADVQGYFTK